MREELHARRRAKIVAAARVVFTAQGYTRAKTADVARLARVSIATLYVHFENKQALFDAFTISALAPYEGPFELAERRAGDARTVLTNFALVYFDFMASPDLRSVYRAVGAETNLRPELGVRLYQYAHNLLGGSLRRILARLAARGELVLDDLPMASRLLEGMLEAVTLTPSMLGGDGVETGVDSEAYCERVVDIFLAGYGPAEN
ncbi:MAG TPA: TetR/AcrR family transcriptional regulator [Caulobacter sp.]|nr:TetR/AcrR family transcriptional regulator [Caulobacter sp.]